MQFRCNSFFSRYLFIALCHGLLLLFANTTVTAYDTLPCETVYSQPCQQGLGVAGWNANQLDLLLSVDHTSKSREKSREESATQPSKSILIASDEYLRLLEQLANAEPRSYLPELLNTLWQYLSSFVIKDTDQEGPEDNGNQALEIQTNLAVLRQHLALSYHCDDESFLRIQRRSHNDNADITDQSDWQQIDENMRLLGYDRIEISADSANETLTLQFFQADNAVPESLIWQLSSDQPVLSELESFVCPIRSSTEAFEGTVYSLLSPNLIHELSLALSDRLTSGFIQRQWHVVPVEHTIDHDRHAVMTLDSHYTLMLPSPPNRSSVPEQALYWYLSPPAENRFNLIPDVLTEDSYPFETLPGILKSHNQDVSKKANTVGQHNADTTTTKQHQHCQQTQSVHSSRDNSDDDDGNNPSKARRVCPDCLQPLSAFTKHVCPLGNDVEADGRVCETTSFPPAPGYKPPLHPADMYSRMASFICRADFPIPPQDAAQAGHYLLGSLQHTRCFSCGFTMTDWNQYDNPFSPEWHSNDCEHYYHSENSVKINQNFEQLNGILPTLRSQELASTSMVTQQHHHQPNHEIQAGAHSSNAGQQVPLSPRYNNDVPMEQSEQHLLQPPRLQSPANQRPAVTQYSSLPPEQRQSRGTFNREKPHTAQSRQSQHLRSQELASTSMATQQHHQANHDRQAGAHFSSAVQQLPLSPRYNNDVPMEQSEQHLLQPPRLQSPANQRPAVTQYSSLPPVQHQSPGASNRERPPTTQSRQPQQRLPQDDYERIAQILSPELASNMREMGFTVEIIEEAIKRIPAQYLCISNQAELQATLLSAIMPENNEVARHETPSRSASAGSHTQSASRSASQAEINRLRFLEENYPCIHPINPHMRTREARLQTFTDNSARWPAHKTRATPQQIVDAGMYYLGVRDRVKCWYCNGGLQNWDKDDDPWAEHAKWFPLCEYVLQQKGPEFVHRIVSLFPGLERPPLYNPSRTAPSELQPYAGTSQARRPERSPVIVDPQRDLKERNAVISRWCNSEMAKQAKGFGFDDNSIRTVCARQYDTNKREFEKLEEMVERLVNLQPEGNSEEMTGAQNTQELPQEATALPLEEQLKRLEMLKKCRLCRNEDANMVLMPCGHLPICAECAKTAKNCPICDVIISKKIRSYPS